MWFGLVNLVLVKLRRGVRGHPGVWLMRIRLVSVAVCLARQVAPQVGLQWVAQTLAGLIPSVYPQFSPQLRLLWSITSILITINTYITLTICSAIHIQACRLLLHQIEALS